jgi:hypothetical protein
MVRKPYKYGGYGKLPDTEMWKGQSGKSGVLYRQPRSQAVDERYGWGRPYKKSKSRPAWFFIPFSKFRRVK